MDVLNQNLRVSLCLSCREWCAVVSALDEYIDSSPPRDDVAVLVTAMMKIDTRLEAVETALGRQSPLPVGGEMGRQQLQA